MLGRLDELELGEANQREELVATLSALEREGWAVDILGYRGRSTRIRIRPTIQKAGDAERGSKNP